MDNSLKEIEAQLESLVPRGLSDEGEKSCSDLIDQLAAGNVVDLSSERLGLSWKASAAAAVVALGVGLGSGWQLGRDAAPTKIAEAEPVSINYFGGFDIIEHPVEVMSEGIVNVYTDEAGEVREVWNEVEVEKETSRPVCTSNIITWSKVDRHKVEVVKSQF